MKFTFTISVVLALSLLSSARAAVFGTDVPGDGDLNCYPRSTCPTLVGQVSSAALVSSPVNLTPNASTLNLQLSTSPALLTFSGVNNPIIGPLGLNPYYNPSKISSVSGNATRDATIPVSGQLLFLYIQNTSSATLVEIDFYLQSKATALPNGQSDGLTFGAYCTGSPDSGQCSQKPNLALLQTPTCPGTLNPVDTSAGTNANPNPTFGDVLRCTGMNLAPMATGTFVFLLTDNNGTRSTNTNGMTPNATFTLQIVPSTPRTPTFLFRDTLNAIRAGIYPSSTLVSAGGVFASDPAAAQDASGNTFAVGRSNAGNLWVNVFNSGNSTWAGWNFAGGVFQGVPTIAVTSGQTAYFAGRDTSNGYWINSYTAGSGFGGWANLGGVFSTDPVIASVPDGSFYVVGKDNSNAIWSGRYIPGTGFQGWFFQGGVVKGKPSVAGGSDGAAYIAVRDTSDGVWMARVFHNALTGWFPGGGVVSTDPQVASLGNGTNCTVILDSGGSTWYHPFVEGTGNGWQAWTFVGGVLQNVAPAGSNGELFVVGRTPGQDLWWWRQTGSQWTSIGNTGVSTGSFSAAPR